MGVLGLRLVRGVWDRRRGRWSRGWLLGGRVLEAGFVRARLGAGRVDPQFF